MRQHWALRARLVAQRFWQPTTACLTCMPGFANVVSPIHWEIALRTGLATGALVLLLSFTRLKARFHDRYFNALLVGLLTALGDAYSHESHYGTLEAEALLTGLVAALLALAASWLFEDRAARVRTAWARIKRE